MQTLGAELVVGENPLLTGLDAFAEVDDIAGYVRIGGNAELRNLSGLNELDAIGSAPTDYLLIEGNAKLASLAALSELKVLPGALDIRGNSALVNLDGLEGLTAARDVLVFSNDGLLSVHGLNNLSDVARDLSVIDNPALLSVDGLQGLRTVGRSLFVQSNDHIADVTALSGVTTVSSSFAVRWNPLLPQCQVDSLVGSSSLTIFGSTLIDGNTGTGACP